MPKTYGLETDTREFKTSLVFSNKNNQYRPEEQQYNVFKSVCAFLNTRGGEIYVGVKEDEKGVGYELTGADQGIFADMEAMKYGQKYYFAKGHDSDAYSRWVQDAIFKYFSEEVDDVKNFVRAIPDTENVVVIKVDPYRQKVVHMHDGEAMMRVGTTSRKMEPAQIHQLEEDIKRSRITMTPEFEKREALKKAIAQEKYVTLVKYKSNYSNTIKDRYVEPIDFQDGDSVITCVDPTNDNHRFSCFKISRFERVIISDNSWQYKDMHNDMPELGLFGWTGPQQEDVSVFVPLAVRNILLEQFPSITPRNFFEYGDEYLFCGYTRKIEIPAVFFNRYRDYIHDMSENLAYAMDKIEISHIEDPESKRVELLSLAIRTKKKVVLVKYRSSNSQTIADRKVEPMMLQCNQSIVTCYEADNPTHKIGSFRISRMDEVILLDDEPWTDEDKHQERELDMFGWSGDECVTFTALINVSVKNRLMEMYPGISETDFRVQGDKILFIGETRHMQEPAKFFLDNKEFISEPSAPLELAMEGLMPQSDSEVRDKCAAIRRAISEHRLVLLEAYRSSNSQQERDRYVEPIEFQYGDSYLIGYEEAASHDKIRTWRVSHMNGVRVLDQYWEHEQEHAHVELDVFGWPIGENVTPISINVSVSVKNMLMEQYPGISTACFEKWNNNKYRFTARTSHIEVPAKLFVPHMALVSEPSAELKDEMDRILGNKPIDGSSRSLPQRFAAAWKIIKGKD